MNKLLGFVTASALALGCLPDPTTPNNDAAVAVTYTKDVQPIFMAKCGGIGMCHSGMGLGGHNIATTYADALKPVTSVDSHGCWNDVDMTMPKKIGECTIILINNGQMPYGSGCNSTPPLSPENCLTAAEKATITAWVAGGMPQ